MTPDNDPRRTPMDAAPRITEETTLRELQAILAANRSCHVEAFAMGRVTEPTHFKASLTVVGEEGSGPTLAAALDDALRVLRSAEVSR